MLYSPGLMWIATAAVAGVDLLAAHRYGWQFANVWRLAGACSATGAIALFYHLSGRSARLAAAAHWVVLWLLFTPAADVLTYVAAAQHRPLCDTVLAAADARLGFDWMAWFDLVARHPALHWVLAIAYNTLLLQIVAAILYFSLSGQDHRNGELLVTMAVALLLTTIIFALFPALGPGIALAEFRHAYGSDLLALRAGHLATIDLAALKGMIQMPSFHAVLAVLFVHAYRGRRGFWPVVALNLMLLAATPSTGGHYLVDVPAGITVALLSIAAIRALQYRAAGFNPVPVG